jgi:hypothetical protein
MSGNIIGGARPAGTLARLRAWPASAGSGRGSGAHGIAGAAEHPLKRLGLALWTARIGLAVIGTGDQDLKKVGALRTFKFIYRHTVTILFTIEKIDKTQAPLMQRCAIALSLMETT